MVISSKYQIDIPKVDLLSYLFDKSLPNFGVPLYIDANDPSRRINKNELEILARKVGYGLKESAGLLKGETVLVCAGNSILFPAVLLGTICAGGIFTGANPAYTTDELIHQLRVSSAKVIVTDTATAAKVLTAADALGIPHSSIFIIDDKFNSASQNGCHSFTELLQDRELHWQKSSPLDPVHERTAVLNFSSGTTGPSKACMITQHNLVANTEQILHVEKVAASRANVPRKQEAVVCCAYVPLYHAMGMHSFCVLNVRRSATTVVMSKFDLAQLLDNVQKFKITKLLTPPPVAVLIIKSPLTANYDLSSVKQLLCGAAPLGKETAIQLEQRFEKSGVRVQQGYGMTEATCTVTTFAPDEFDPEHSGSGYLAANMEAKIVNDDGKEVGVGEVGEALIRGPNVFKGYWKNEEATKEAWTADGWMKTGDYVTVQADGLFSVVDRKKELIKVRGFQVAPSELEANLLECDLVQDCAVIRVLRNGEECPQAHVVPKGKDVTSQAILDFMNKRLVSYKRITGGVVFTDSIPKSPAGKILRRLIKDPGNVSKS